MEDDSEYLPQARANLVPCRSCGRTFSTETLKRHEAICKKNAVKQRKVFDSSKQRSIGAVQKNTRKQQKQYFKPQESRRSNWRAKHEEFIQTVRAARGVTQALKEGKDLPPPPPPTINPDYIQCPHCLRRFNVHAAERHIKFCSDQHKRLETQNKAKTAATMKASEKQDRRTSYRPPMPSSGVRRTGNSHQSTSGYSSSNSQISKQQRPPARAKTLLTMQERSRNKVSNTRYLDDQTFDTRVPSSAVATTRTGLKARILTSSSSSDLENSEISKHERTRGTVSFASKLYDSHSRYVPSTDPKGGRNGHEPRKILPNHGDHFEDKSPEFEKKIVTRKVSNSRTRGESLSKRNNSSLLANGDISDILNAHNRVNAVDEFPVRDTDSRHPQSRRGRSTFEKEKSSPFVQEIRHKGYADPTNSSAKNITSEDVYNGRNGVTPSRFCHECGTRYPVKTAKFCCECGMKRIMI